MNTQVLTAISAAIAILSAKPQRAPKKAKPAPKKKKAAKSAPKKKRKKATAKQKSQAKKNQQYEKKFLKVNSQPENHRGVYEGNATFVWKSGPNKGEKQAMPVKVSKGDRLSVSGGKLMVKPKKGELYEYGGKSKVDKFAHKAIEIADMIDKMDLTSAAKKAREALKPIADNVTDGLKKAGAKVQSFLGGVSHAVTDPLKKAWKLVTEPKYRTEVKQFVIAAAKQEAAETKKMAGTLRSVLTGKAVSAREKTEAIHQALDIAKVAAMGAFAGKMALGGIGKLLATCMSPVDEVAAVVIDPRLRKLTKKVTGREHGLLPSAFYGPVSASVLSASYQSGDEWAIVMRLTDALMDELAEDPPSDEELLGAVKVLGGDLKKLKSGLEDLDIDQPAA